MSTSLAEQLKRLALPQTTALKRDKKRPSLLFDPKEAANLSKETVYQIGIDGLEELRNRDPVFAQFENTLFHITSKEFERSVETAEANQRLDKNVRRFLYLLSPYFLFNCSYKALEWLVHRYYIHEYNKEDLLMLILPYHDTNIFVRVLQLMNLKEANDAWVWLRSLQKHGIHLPKQTLYNHAASSVHFLEFVAKNTLAMIKEYKNPKSLTIVFNFYCTTFTGALEYSEEVNEAQISQMLPILIKGLSSDIADFAASSYVISAKLLTKTNLSDKILDKFIEKICQMNAPTLKTEALVLLIVLYQSQPQYSKMPILAIKHLQQKEGITKLIQKFNNDGIHIYPLLFVLIRNCTEMILLNDDCGNCKSFVNSLIDDTKIEDNYIDDILLLILNVYKSDHKYAPLNIEWLKELLKKLEIQYPIAFDMALKKRMTLRNDSDNTHLKAIHKLIGNVLSMKSNYELFEKLYHPNSKIRIEGIRLLLKKSKKINEKNKELFQNALLDRINDDSIDVVVETLHLFKLQFINLVDLNLLKNSLLKLLDKCHIDIDNWWEACYACLNVLVHYFSDSDVKVFFAVLPYLLPVCTEELKAAKIIIKSSLAKNSKIFGPLGDQLNNFEIIEFFNVMYKVITNSNYLFDVKTIVEALKDMQGKENDVLFKYLSMLILTVSLPKNCDVEICNLVVDIFEIYLNTSKVVVVKGETNDMELIKLAKRQKFSLQGFLYCTEKLMLKTKPYTGLIHSISFTDSANEEYSKCYLRLLNILLKGSFSSKQIKSGAYSSTLQKFQVHFCQGDLISVIELFLNVAVAENNLITIPLRLNCIQNVCSILQDEKNLTFLDFNCIVVPYLLISLFALNSEARQKLIETINHLILNSNVTSNNYFKLLQKLTEYQEEILLDNEQLPLVLFNILSTNKDEDLRKSLDKLIDLIHSSNYPVYFKAGLLCILTYINNYEIYKRTALVAIEILAKHKKENLKDLNKSECEILIKNVQRFDTSIAKIVDSSSSIYELLKLAIQSDYLLLKNIEESPTSISVLMLNQIDRKIFSNMNREVKSGILDIIIEIATNSQNPEVLQEASHCFKRIDLDATLVMNQLEEMRDVRSPKENPEKRKRRVNITPTVDILDTLQWKKGVTVLEFIQDKKKIYKFPSLLGVLFDVLKKCLDFEEQASVEYPKQLLLSTILHCCKKNDDEPLPENAFNMQLVVQCIRVSQNPQTHHHALLLLSQSASLIPKQVLHHIIAIFTFMGSSVLRHDDAYSFQIITKIIDTVIPILTRDGTIESIATVLRVFVDAILDIPEHRRLPLFKQLLTKLNAKENLHLFLLIIFEAHVVHGQVEKQKAIKSRPHVIIDEVSKRLDIAAILSREFSVEIVITNCINILKYLHKLPEEKSDTSENFNEYTFDIKRYTAKQFRHYKYVIVVFISGLLSSKKFVMQVAALSDEEMKALEPTFKDMIINILKYIQETSKIAERNVNTPQSQYWKTILHYSYDILDAMNALLTDQMFLLVIRGLMVYSLSTVRKRALDLLNNKLQHNTDLFNEYDKTELYNIIVLPLINTIKIIEQDKIESDQEQIIQRALISVKLIAKHLAAENSEKFVQILDFTSNLVKTGLSKINDNVLASFILCVAELCYCLRAHAISSLNTFMPILIKLLKSQKRCETPSLLLMSCIAALHKILDSLPLFLSPYMEKLLFEISMLLSQWNLQSEDPKLLPLITKLKNIQQKIGSVLPLRVLLPATQTCFDNLVNKNCLKGVAPLMAILSENLSQLKGADIQGNLTELTNFFLSALQFRVNAQGTLEEIEDIEMHVINAFVALVLKLSESTFRPLYYKVFDWAIRTDAKTERVITFYNISSIFANCLKGLFVLFAGHFLNNASTLLEACNKLKNEELYFEDDEKNIALLEHILKTMHAVFLYDTQRFINKERFEVLMQPLADQLENSLGGIAMLQKRSKTILIPCIAQFVVATADDALWKQINYQILLKTRHNSPEIRLIALETVCEVVKKVGEDFLPLLPETIPFLAELLEDEDEGIEKACQKAVQEMEKVLGESLQKYF